MVRVIEAGHEETLPVGTERILFVDDEECIAETCGELLEYQGYSVTCVTSSLKALEIFKANPESFDLVFTDQTMPNLTGSEMSKAMLDINSDLSIVLCSGYSDSIDRSGAESIGITAYIDKPMNMKSLFKVINELRPN